MPLLWLDSVAEHAEEARQPPAAQTSNKEQPTVDAEAHPSDAHPAELQQPPAVGAAVAQAMPSAGSIQRQHGYLADSLRDNKQREADAGGYVSNRDRQQSYRQHPYHRTRHDDHGYRGPSDHR